MRRRSCRRYVEGSDGAAKGTCTEVTSAALHCKSSDPSRTLTTRNRALQIADLKVQVAAAEKSAVNQASKLDVSVAPFKFVCVLRWSMWCAQKIEACLRFPLLQLSQRFVDLHFRCLLVPPDFFPLLSHHHPD